MAKTKILIVEDEIITAMDLQMLCEMKGHKNVKIIASGEEAVKLSEEGNIGLMIMDIKLKGELNGIETVEHIKQKQDVSVIYISGNTDLLKSERLKLTNPIGILTKPYLEYELSDMLKHLNL